MRLNSTPLLTRRHFFRTSAAGLAAALGVPDTSRVAPVAGSGTIRIDMIGCGGRCSGAGAQALGLGKDVKPASSTCRPPPSNPTSRAITPRQFRAKPITCETLRPRVDEGRQGVTLLEHRNP